MQAAAQDIRSWLRSLPSETVARLNAINNSATSSHHIILALSYGMCDSNIWKLNRMIIGLLLSRLKAEQRADTLRIERINAKLNELHHAIDDLTGVVREHDESEACKSVKKRMLRAS